MGSFNGFLDAKFIIPYLSTSFLFTDSIATTEEFVDECISIICFKHGCSESIRSSGKITPKGSLPIILSAHLIASPTPFGDFCLTK